MLYKFKCDGCGIEYEVTQKMNDEHNHNCHNCGLKTRRIYTPAFHKFTFFYGWDHALGAYCDTKKDKERIMREKNLIEQ